MTVNMLDPDDAGDVFEKKPREYKGGPKGPRERKEDQIPWDLAFQSAWHSSSKVLAVQVTPDDAENARKHVAASARFFGLGYTEGLPKPGHEEGYVILAWKIREVKKRAKNDETQEELPVD